MRMLFPAMYMDLSAAGSRSKNSATNQKRAYGVGTELVRTGYARIRPGILMGRTHVVRSGYGLQGGGGDNIGSNRCRINF